MSAIHPLESSWLGQAWAPPAPPPLEIIQTITKRGPVATIRDGGKLYLDLKNPEYAGLFITTAPSHLLFESAAGVTTLYSLNGERDVMSVGVTPDGTAVWVGATIAEWARHLLRVWRVEAADMRLDPRWAALIRLEWDTVPEGETA